MGGNGPLGIIIVILVIALIGCIIGVVLSINNQKKRKKLKRIYKKRLFPKNQKKQVETQCLLV